MDKAQPEKTKRCPFCGEEIPLEAFKCRACSEWLPQPQELAPGTQLPGGQGVDPLQLKFAYDNNFDLNRLSPSQLEQFKQHSLQGTFPVAVIVLLHFLTLGIFTTIYFGLKHSKLPMVRPDDFSAGKAIGFLFIPFFNLYWAFVFWLRLADRINFQFRLRGLSQPIDRGLVTATMVMSVIPFCCIWVISWLIMFPIMAGKIQSACNSLALEAAQSPMPGAPRFS